MGATLADVLENHHTLSKWKNHDHVEKKAMSQFTGEVFSDLNEPPSKLALLQQEIAQHPWTLEQDWYVESSMDEKSKLTIEKMMLEEQMYLNGETLKEGSSACLAENPPKPLNLQGASHKAVPGSSRRQWTESEKDTFFKGLEIFGRKWSKIAELLPNRSVLQVKHFGYSHFRKKDPASEKSNTEGSSSKNVPFIPNSTPESHVQPSTSTPANGDLISKQIAATDGNLREGVGGSNALVNTQNLTTLQKFPDSEVIRLNKELSSDSEDIDIDIEDDTTMIPRTEHSQHDSNTLTGHSIDITRESPAKRCLSEIKGISNCDLAKEQRTITEDKLTVSQDRETIANETLAPCHNFQCKYKNSSRSPVSPYSNDVGTDSLAKPYSEIGRATESEPLEESQNSDEDLPSDSFSIQGSDGLFFALPNPSEEIDITNDSISDQETEIFCEFFDGRPGIKTAERYLKIRNHIVSVWKNTKPSYLYKTCIRNGLKKCGDVNIIGRIHAYLEQIGAINFGCEECQYNRKGKVVKKANTSRPATDLLLEAVLAKKDTLNQRKRKVRDIFGVWIDEKEMEGRTIDHEAEMESIVRKAPPKIKRRKPTQGYDPFKLVTCKDFTNAVPAPFEVQISWSAMTVMDVHAHLCKAEVIGLLGGVYDARRGVLMIDRAEPCESLSTGMQCEMDPVSQTEASEDIRKHKLKVVGWYHSHPTVPPNPSVRDIETQQTFQEWFSVGKMPFVGLIVNPYNISAMRMTSDVRCLCISKPKHLNNTDMGSPYQFKYRLMTAKDLAENTKDKVFKLVAKYSKDKNRVEMLRPLGESSDVTCVDKLCSGLKDHLKGLTSIGSKDNLLHDIKDNITSAYQDTDDAIK